MDFKATLGRALPARPEHALRMTVLPLRERAVVLRQAAWALRPHLLLGRLLPAEESPTCHSLIALGGRTCLGLKGRPYFAARGEMVRMLEGLAAHCVTQWQRRLSRPIHAAPMADFLGGFFPPAPAGKAPLRPYQRRPRCPPARPVEQSASSGAAQPVAAQGVLSSRRGLGKGRGSTGGLCPTHGVPSCERCRATGQGVANCCWYGRAGHPMATGAPTGWGSYITRPGMRRLPQAERVSAARGMHGWLRRPSESENRNAPSPPSPAAQEPDNRMGPGKGRKRALAGDPADGTQRQQKRHKAAKDAAGGSQPKDLAPPPPTGHPAP